MNRNLVRWLALLALPLGALACAKPSADGAKGSPSGEAHAEAFARLTVEELDAKMAEAKAGKLALHIFDNNKKARFEKGHIPGAKWVDPDTLKAGDLPSDKEATLVFYCANDH